MAMQDSCRKEIGSDPFVTCPYNPAHSMLKSRLATHIIKCQKAQQVQGIKNPIPMKLCRFNSSHVVPEHKLKHHENNCEDRKTFDCYKFTPVTNTVDPLERADEHPPSIFEPVETSENWDNVNAVSYDPEKYVSEAKVIRLKVGAPPSVRKDFRRTERLRLLQLNN